MITQETSWDCQASMHMSVCGRACLCINSYLHTSYIPRLPSIEALQRHPEHSQLRCHQSKAASLHNHPTADYYPYSQEMPLCIKTKSTFFLIKRRWQKWTTKLFIKKDPLIPGFICCKVSALIIWIVSFVRAQWSEIRSLAASKSLRVSILRAAEGKFLEDPLNFPFPWENIKENVSEQIQFV